MSVRTLCLSLATATLAIAGARVALASDCASVSMTISAAPSTDPNFPNMWKYTVTGSWSVTPRALSHLDFFVALMANECTCAPGVVGFPAVAGTSTGEPEPCTVEYDGMYLCDGDPTAPSSLNVPTVKYEAKPGQSCEPSTEGSGTWYFYSVFPPAGPSTIPDGVGIKYGSFFCTGPLTGTLPTFDCSTPARPGSWGQLKIRYR